MPIETFDDFTDGYQNREDSNNGVPFQFREDTTIEGTHEWLKNNFEASYEDSRMRLTSYRRWSELFKGIHWRSMRDTNRFSQEMSERKPRVVDNYIWELVTRKAAQSAQKSISFTALPYNGGDQDDINNAKACSLFLKARAEEIELEDLHTKADFMKYKYGTSILQILWDPEDGDYSPLFRRLKELYGSKGVPKKILDKLGIDEVRQGDVIVKNIAPYEFFPQRGAKSWDDVLHYDTTKWVNIYELKAEYPNKKDKILENTLYCHDMETGQVSQPQNEILVREFFHKPTRYLPEGAYIKYTEDVILEWEDYPYSNMDSLNIVIDRDIEFDNEIWGRPTISVIEQMQRHINNIEAGMARDLGVGSAPKWVMPKGSADFRTLNNEFTIVEFKGPMAPQLIQNNPISPQCMDVIQHKSNRMTKLMRIGEISRGEVPPGVTANSALRFLDEQSSLSVAEDEKRRSRRVRKVYRKMATVMAEYYHETDERMVRTLGQNNEYLVKSMKKANFNQVSDIRILNSSALPDTKTGKLSAIIDMNMATQTDPVFKKEEIVQIMDLATEDAFVDQASASANTAAAIFQAMLEGELVPEPSPSDNLLVHYSVFTKRIQDYGFKTRVRPEIRQAIEDYVLQLEYLMSEKMKHNPKLAHELAQNDYFPIFWTPAPPNPEMGIEGDQVSGDPKGVGQEFNAGGMKNAQEQIQEEAEKEL